MRTQLSLGGQKYVSLQVAAISIPLLGKSAPSLDEDFVNTRTKTTFLATFHSTRGFESLELARTAVRVRVVG